MNTAHDKLPEKPRPNSPAEHEPWWQALKAHRLVAQRCTSCHQLRLYPRPMCDTCYSLAYDWAELSGEGTVHSWCVSHHAFNPGFKRDLPYLTVTVDLKEGLRLHAPLHHVDHNKVKIGMPLVADFDDTDGNLTTLCFKPRD